MPRAGIHPMLHRVRIVLTNGASYILPMAWHRPYPGLEVTTKFMTEDYLTHERFTGVENKAKAKVGRRARFENKFKAAGGEDDGKDGA